MRGQGIFSFLIIACLVATGFLTLAAKRDIRTGDTPYFTLHYTIGEENQMLKVTDKTLRTQWWSQHDKIEIKGNGNLFTRASKPHRGMAHNIIKNHFGDLQYIIDKFRAQIHIPACDGEIIFNPTGVQKFHVENQIHGQDIDTNALAHNIFNSLRSGKHNDIFVNVFFVPPKSPDEIIANIKRRGGFSTNYPDNDAREKNIALSLHAFNGMTVAPDEIVSFNTVVGRRTEENGYETAKIIQNGEFVDGVGGGVCQTSTTLFNAVLLSGLEIVKSYNHSLPISYVPLGRDAMVSSLNDLKFKNNTDGNIYIEARAIDKGNQNTAVINIYGEPIERGITFKPRVITEEKEIETKKEGDAPVGGAIYGRDRETGRFWYLTENITQNGSPAYETLTYIDTVKNGLVIKSKLIRRSRYKGKPKIVEYVRTIH